MSFTRARALVLAGLLPLTVISGCATPQQTKGIQLSLTPDPSARIVRLEQDTPVDLPGGHARSLQGGSRWRAIGSIAHGQVYRAVDSVFVLAGRDMQEAYLVVSAGRLVGLFLPAESSYTALGSTVPIAIASLQ